MPPRPEPLVLTDGALEALVLTLTRGEQRVTLMAAVHVASPESWDRLNAELRGVADRGELLMLEGVGRPSPEALEALPRATRRGAQVLLELAEVSSRVARRSSLAFQGDALELAPDAEVLRNDIDLLTLVEMHGARPPLPLPGPLQRWFERGIDRLEIGPEHNALLARMGSRRSSRARAALLRLLTGVRTEILIDARDERAAREIAATERSLTTLWGAAHVPGITDRLLDAGFTVTGSRRREVLPSHDWRLRDNSNSRVLSTSPKED